MAEERVQRRLAAILAADVVGYSRMMGEDEAGTLDRLKVLRRELFEPKIKQFGGRIFKTTGDGALVEFKSAVDAVNSAVDIQRAITEREETLDHHRSIQLRIGISLGDVIVEGSDLYGNGVNVAARMEGLADAGGICISANVYEHLRGATELDFDDLGEQQVKNMDRPVRAYRVALDRRETMSPIDSNSLPLADKPSVAVLPFDNLSNDPEQEYFSDGLVEDLITDISKISGLFVIARNSSFAFKGQPVDVREIARKLGVKHVVEGSVRKMGSKLRINAQLIDAASGGHVWAERYDGDIEDIFQFQDDIREQIVSALQVSLTPTDKKLTERKPTDSVEAYDRFLRGRAHCYRYTPEDLREAIKCFEEAIEIDPDFAAAYGYLSYCYFYGWALLWPGFDDSLDRANELAEKGVALDSTSAIAVARLGWIQTFLRRYDSALANMEKAIALAPDNADVIATFAQVLNYWGDPDRGLQLQEKAFSIDTFAPPYWEWQMGLSHFLLRHYDQAIAGFNRAVPKFSLAYTHLACIYVELDRLDDARDAIRKFLELSPQFTVKWMDSMLPYRLEEVRNRIFDGVRTAGLPE